MAAAQSAVHVDRRAKLVGEPLPEFALEPANPERPGVATLDFRDGQAEAAQHLRQLVRALHSGSAPACASWSGAGRISSAWPCATGRKTSPPSLPSTAIRSRRIGADNIGEVQLGIGSSGVPETFVIDGKGTIRYQHIGDIRESDVPLLLEKLKEAAE